MVLRDHSYTQVVNFGYIAMIIFENNDVRIIDVYDFGVTMYRAYLLDEYHMQTSTACDSHSPQRAYDNLRASYCKVRRLPDIKIN